MEQSIRSRLWELIMAVTSALGMFAASGNAADSNQDLLRKSVTFYASFDHRPIGDLGGGDLSLTTRFNHETEKGQFVFEKGFDPKVFRIAAGKGMQGGALEVTDVLPRNGRIFFPAKGNIAYKSGGWGGSVAFWMNTNPNTLLKTPFCDPVQITEKGANNGGLWCDFPDVKPRSMRLGAFPAALEGQKPIAESDPAAPLVTLRNVGFQTGEWHHVVLTWKNIDSGQSDARAAMYVDGKLIGEFQDRAIAMRWDIEKTGIYIAVNYIGLLDEFALFNQPLSPPAIAILHQQPGVLAALAKQTGD